MTEFFYPWYNSAMDRVTRVVAGVLVRDGQVLIARRPEGKSLAGYWEFPGGKLEPGETPERALARELVEELGIEVRVGESLGANRFGYAHGEIELLAFWGTVVEGEPSPREHAEIRWVPHRELNRYQLSPADIPFVAKIQHQLRSPAT